MAPNLDLALSRPLAAAATLAGVAADAGRFHTKSVLLSGDPEILRSANGACAFIVTLRLATRICSNVTVSLHPALEILSGIAKAEAGRIAFGKPIAFDPDADPRGFDAVLRVGASAPDDYTATVINSGGWVARVSSVGDLPADGIHQFNPVAAWAAASLGVAEVFKRLIGLPASRGSPFDRLSFSLYSYETGTHDLGPEIPGEPEIDALLVGCGAIGNGVLGVLADFKLRGHLTALDRQLFGDENLGTCVMLDGTLVGQPKTTLAKVALASQKNLILDTVEGEVPIALSQIKRRPRIVCNGLDNPTARRAIQHLWADYTIDGAIGDFMCQVGVHPGDPTIDVGCLRCTVPEPQGADWEMLASTATGLALSRMRNLDAVVTGQDVEAAPASRKDFLRTQVGKTVCSIISAETLAAIANSENSSFAPTVPFVATMSAAMVVGEIIRASMSRPPVLKPRYQFDVLVGPEGGMFFPEGRHLSCDCVTRRELISAMRI